MQQSGQPLDQIGSPRESFPGASWETAPSPESLGWSSARIAVLKASVDSVGSAAFMIVTHGRIVAAWGDTARTFLTHSIRKSFMSALCGMALAEGTLDTARTLGALGIGYDDVFNHCVLRRGRIRQPGCPDVILAAIARSPTNADLAKGSPFGLRRTRDPITEWPQLVEKWLKTIGMISE